MKKILIISSILLLSACEESTNSDGSSTSTYSSCRITSSQALFSSDKINDLSQCWNASGNGYESQANAQAWCASEVTSYISDEYLVGHTVTYAISSNYCN